MPFARWCDRQPDFANYFNPGYVGVLVYSIVKGYNSVSGDMPLALTFPAAAMALHPDIRGCLPRTTATRLSKWLRENPELRTALLSSTQLLVPQVKEAILASLRSEWISAATGNLVATSKGPQIAKSDKTMDVDQKSAAFIGKWFANSGTEKEIYQQIGVRP